MSFRRHGFSFIELCVVLVAIVALSSGAFIAGGSILSAGRHNAAKSDVSVISLAVAQYHFESGIWPTNIAALREKRGQYGPWLHNDTEKDPWGNDYQYAYNPTNSTYAVWSLGPNGINNSGQNPSTFSGDDIGILGH